MDAFTQQLEECHGPLERFVRFRLSGHEADAEDLLQEVLLTAYQHYDRLRDPEKFKPWILQIAQNKCRDYYRRRGPLEQVPLETMADTLTASRDGHIEAVTDTLAALPEAQRQLLEMFYYEELSQREMAARLHIPLGTVKSQLHKAKEDFRGSYPYGQKGAHHMKNFPDKIPDYTITPQEAAPFPVLWEELMGWFLVPKVGEKLRWAMYEFPQRQKTMYTELAATGKAEVHGVEGVEIQALEYAPVASEQVNAQDPVERHLVAQLTDTHCRILAESHIQDGVKKCYTFLDGDAFLKNWGFGPDNQGNPIHLVPAGRITRDRDSITLEDTAWPLDVVGRYTVTLAGKDYDTICVMDVECYDSGVVTEQYLDHNGRTVLWRRFNRDDWALWHFGTPWTQRLPQNQRLTVNGKTYVHWYDCITEDVL